MNEVEEFIQRRFGQTDANWMDGNCYWFARILCDRFMYLSIYYDPIVGHFYAGANGMFYDHKGLTKPEKCPILFRELEKMDDLWYKHIVRDCIL